ncbi:SDR family NAD(P)-dependent oxidoreductase [Burkholderia cepacia]|uniref:SDR family NAD(P)-dependent oxidoreductase n=1 Tax=Burkholderia cepacia TaxID=292 RepID=UPI000F5AE2E6|nr:SDR family NAD(P)-dependent oxidoreductase [Burkholderia cepacia]RQU90592.1 SDR family NAD(P)-dependent oxidoreductase [Burkholderia cenocepacia]RQV30338.1 SDR family NAD(P)-dependent oxidoreductase [Burkholderia cenocepacia]RQV88832.1 SDR family NAD(P)-dependent oxidoreductase [Burkholderia cenocepacia]RQZ91057.1 SDR family NAD(P)-dependent oxidoreductase [Burkholderia cepacia]RQZ98428.1 SDR family NAD(P)-dependent oxidoreductase [Burkholderia cenocepacia]
MHDNPVALVTGANKGIGLQIAKDLAKKGLTVLLGSRRLEAGEAVMKSVGADAEAVQRNVTDPASVASAARYVRETYDPASFSRTATHVAINLVSVTPVRRRLACREEANAGYHCCQSRTVRTGPRPAISTMRGPA